jgi:hypothetical protein
MTDYLTGLVKRTLGLLPVAQPLITPSFSSFTSKMFDRPEISSTENVALFDQQVIPGAQKKEAPQDFSKLRSKGQKTAQSWNEFSSGKVEHLVAGNADNSLLSHKKTGEDNQDQRHPETNFIRHDARSIPQSVHIEKQVPSKDTGIVTEEKYEEQESVTLSDQTPKYPKNNRHRRNPEMMGPKIEEEMMGSRIEKEMQDNDIPDPVSISKSLEDSFSEKYEEGYLLPVLTSDFRTENQRSIDIFSENHTNKKSNLIRQSNLNKKPNLDSSGHKFNLDYPATSNILHEPEKLVSNESPPGRVAQFTEKDRSIVKNQENYEMNRQTGFKNVMDPTKIQQPPIPTIKVTIGRVEVRAVQPQPVFSPSPAMKKPALSLDEYLKQHNR